MPRADGGRHAGLAAALGVPCRRRAGALASSWPRIPSVLVWVADDPEGDGQPLRSGNQRLLLTAVAHAGGDARGEASATVWRTGPGAPVVLAAWRTTGG